MKMMTTMMTTKRAGALGVALVVAASLMWLAAPVARDAERSSAAPDALSWNGLTYNGMTFNGLSFNGLSFNGLTAAGLTLLQQPDGRDALRVLVKCALPQGDELVLDAADGQQRFAGGLGLAPGWAEGPLSASGQHWVSACFSAHVNHFGEPVLLSLRGDHPALTAGVREQAQFTVEEGAFFGNLFAEQPYLASCRGTQRGDAPDLAARVCTVDASDGRTLCGFVDAGSCSTACDSTGSAYGDCRSGADSAESVPEVITVFLKEGAA